MARSYKKTCIVKDGGPTEESLLNAKQTKK